MGWKHIDTGKRSALENMELDAALLLDLKDEKDALLHLYDWERDAATYGHFIDPEKFLNIEGIRKHGIDLAKRPTGGGIVFHNCDFAFSVLVPATSPWFSAYPLDNYAFVNSRVIHAIEQLVHVPAELLPVEPLPLDEQCRSFCMAKPTKYDVMIQGKKIGGAAQRKTRQGFLHQGSISIGQLSDSFLKDMLAPETQVLDGMRQHSFALLGFDWNKTQLEDVRSQLRILLKEVFSDNF